MFLRCLNLALLLLALNVNAALVGPGAVTDVANLYRRPTATSSTVSSNSLNVYLKFENNANDEFGTAFTANNSPTYSAGVISQAINVTKADNSDPCNPIPNSYLSHASNTRYDLNAGDWTIGCWVKITDNTLDQYICNKQAGTSSGYFMVFQGGNAFQIYSFHASGGLQVATASTYGTVANDTWAFVVARKSGTTLEISVDGGAWDSTVVVGNTTDNSEPLYFGQDGAGSDMGGSIDEFFIYKRALTDDEVDKLGGFGAYAGQGATRPQLP